MNTYVSELRAILVKYWNKRKNDAGEYQKQKDQGIYSDFHLEQIATRLNEAAKRDYLSAMDGIKAAQERCNAAVEKWGTLNGEKLVQADIALLNSDIPLTPEDVEDMVERNAGNVTMCRLIGERVKRLHMPLPAETVEIIVTADPSVKLSAYSAIFTKARNVLGTGSSIDVPQLANMLKAKNTAIMDHRFESFCELKEHPEFAKILSTIGDGSELV